MYEEGPTKKGKKRPKSPGRALKDYKKKKDGGKVTIFLRKRFNPRC